MKSLAAAGNAPPSIDQVTIGAEERNRWLAAAYREAPLPDRPRNVLGMLKDVPPAEMEAMLLRGREGRRRGAAGAREHARAGGEGRDRGQRRCGRAAVPRRAAPGRRGGNGDVRRRQDAARGRAQPRGACTPLSAPPARVGSARDRSTARGRRARLPRLPKAAPDSRSGRCRTRQVSPGSCREVTKPRPRPIGPRRSRRRSRRSIRCRARRRAGRRASFPGAGAASR